MTLFASVALIDRKGETVFKRPRKERPADLSQARKSAIRFWRGNLAETDRLLSVLLIREVDGTLEISERATNGGIDKPWNRYTLPIIAGVNTAHIAACMTELSITAMQSQATVPDVLVINGFTYRRDI